MTAMMPAPHPSIAICVVLSVCSRPIKQKYMHHEVSITYFFVGHPSSLVSDFVDEMPVAIR